MKRYALGLLLSAMLAGGAGADPAPGGAGGGQQPAFEAFKRLAGEWAALASASGPAATARATFKVTAGGSAVLETEMPGTDHEMITVIRPDGKDLALTHYCAMGNQPEMRAPATFDGKKIAFRFVRAGNLPSEKDAHMHAVTYTFVDEETLQAEWTLYRDGKPAGKALFEMKRVK